MFRFLLFFFVIFIVNIAQSFEVTVEKHFKEIVKGDIFQLSFIVATNTFDEPFISFVPAGVIVFKKDVIKRPRTIFQSKKVVNVADFQITYTMRAKKTGFIKLSNILVDVGKIQKQVENITFNVLRQKTPPKRMFIKAIPSKETVYVNEGLNIRYYRFNRKEIRIHGADIREFPKFENFIKRYHDVQARVQIVDYEGFIFQRVTEYGARLFPQREGELYITPVKMKVNMVTTSKVVPINVQSNAVKIKVTALPEMIDGKAFSGLVGEHKFSILFNERKLMINMPIKIILEVEGPGLLEKFSAPKLFENNNLEEFDIKSEIKQINFYLSKKVFEYTFLAKTPLEIKKNSIEIIIFDQEKKEYVSKYISIPEIKVSNETTIVNNSKKSIDLNQTLKNKMTWNLFKNNKYSKTNWIHVISLIILILSLLLIMIVMLPVMRNRFHFGNCRKLIRVIEIDGLSYARLFELLQYLAPSNEISTLRILVDKSSLTDSAKDYFTELISISEKVSYKDSDEKIIYQFDKAYFNELKTEIKKINNGHI